MRTQSHRRCTGFTLLEVVLTLAITSILVGAIGSAVHIHLRVVEAGRVEVEQAQLARALLRRIADDLRAAVPVPKPQASSSEDDLADIASSAASAAGANGLSGSGGSSGSTGGSSSGGSLNGGSTSNSGGSGSSGSSSSSGGSSSGSETTTSEADATAKQPNFYGSQYQLQFDVGRIPDVQQFAALSSDAAMSGSSQPADTLSDVKTVMYYVGNATSAAAAADPFAPVSLNPGQVNGGLIRNETSRVTSAFAYSQGGSTTTAAERVLATEVTALEFRYYDGAQWLTDWDSASYQTLPLCVEALLTLRTTAPDAATDPLSLLTASDQIIERSYRILVHVPAADTEILSGGTTDAATSESSTSETESTQ